VKLTDSQRNRVRELIDSGASNATVVSTLKSEFGVDVSVVNIANNYRKVKQDTGFDITKEGWYKRSKRLDDIDEDMLALIERGYKKLLDYVDNVVIDNPKDAIAVVQAIKQAQQIYDRFIIPTRSKEKRRDLEKEILS
jgi:hypothetical protein